MRRVFNRRVFLASVVLVVAAIVVPPYIYVNRFKPRVASALSSSLGRPVSIGDVSLRLFPRPGLELSQVVVEDDRSFSEEPLLRADQVTASLRLMSLWRGRLELARLSFQYPSLNLVRREDGHWNLESLLERARQTPVAPTARRTPGGRTRFPYIEFNSGRVNLKLGREKTVYALSEADFALWLAREDEWNLRLKARPIRTDANLGDTGTVTVQGSVGRGASLSDMPVKMNVLLQEAQLGQLTTLIYGRDRGWRGTSRIGLVLQGTPSDLSVTAGLSVDDFRRYDIFTPGAQFLTADCKATFSSLRRTLSNLYCTAPLGNGAVEARGTVRGLLPVQGYEISITARELPASEVARLVRHMKKDLPEDVSAAGTMNAQFAVERAPDSAPTWSGTGSLSGFALLSGRLGAPLTIERLNFGLPVAATRARPVRGHAPVTAPMPEGLVVEPFALDLGGLKPARALAAFTRTGYRITLSGDAGLQRLLRVSEALGVAAPRFSPEGPATLDLSVAGEWAGFTQPLVLGSAKVRATAPVSGIGDPVQISSATVKLLPDGVSIQDLSFGWPKSGVVFTGSLQVPRRCTTIETCPVQFQLRSENLAIEDLNSLLNPQAQKRPWYSIMGGADRPSLLARMTASGTIAVGSLRIRRGVAKNVAGNVTFAHGMLSATKVSAVALGGKLAGTLKADFDATPPVFSASGRLEGGTVAAFSGPVRQNWGTGALEGTFALQASGLDLATLQKTANGNIKYSWRNGTLALSLDGRPGPLRIVDFRGTATLRDGRLSFAPSRMETPGGIYTVSGTASLDQQLGLTFARGNTPAYEVTGTLDKPKVKATSAPQTQAKLQP